MGGKDITEKALEAYNEVFADIVNVLLFKGEQIISPEELEDQTPRSVYKADDRIREVERDVAKRWVKNNIRIACIGLENQTASDPYMPLRVLGYDGVEYLNQLKEHNGRPSPVVTLVLYFGYKGHWKAPLTLAEALQVPEILKPYITDVKINLFEIAYLSREQVSRFRSDFREVASYFVQMRETGEYVPSSDRMEHIESVLQLLNVMDKDHRFEMAVNQERGAKEVRTMSEWLTRVINESEAKGVAKGVAQGMEKGRMEGSLEVLAGLVKDGLLPVTEAAKRAGMTVAEFGKRTGIAVQ